MMFLIFDLQNNLEELLVLVHTCAKLVESISRLNIHRITKTVTRGGMHFVPFSCILITDWVVVSAGPQLLEQYFLL